MVGIVDMVKRIVKPGAERKNDGGVVEKWCFYCVLSSVEVERRKSKAEKGKEAAGGEEGDEAAEDEEEEAFEKMVVDDPEKKVDGEMVQAKKVPVLTVWMTRKSILPFKDAFGEQTFEVQRMLEDD